MGEVRAKIAVQNFEDIVLSENGYLDKNSIRSVELDTLVDIGAVQTLLPQDAVEALGLKLLKKEIVTLANEQKIEMYRAGTIYVTVCNRTWTGDCWVGPPRCELLLGQIIMEALNLVVNPARGTLTVDPQSPFLPSSKLK